LNPEDGRSIDQIVNDLAGSFGFQFEGVEGQLAPFASDVSTVNVELTDQPILEVNTMPEDGADLRDGLNGTINLLSSFASATDEFGDFDGGAEGDANPAAALVAASVILPRIAPPAAFALRGFASQMGLAAGVRVAWSQLPAIVRQALAAIGVTGAWLIWDVAGNVPGPDIFGPRQAVTGAPFPMSEVVGTWNANGVTFYRLMDGKLAVQNKKGRWKVWKPKKPVVLYAGGAANLKTLLRADKILDKQAKDLRRMLDRRAPRARRSAPKQPNIVAMPSNPQYIALNPAN